LQAALKWLKLLAEIMRSINPQTLFKVFEEWKHRLSTVIETEGEYSKKQMPFGKIYIQ
jgi:hypothetical protein